VILRVARQARVANHLTEVIDIERKIPAAVTGSAQTSEIGNFASFTPHVTPLLRRYVVYFCSGAHRRPIARKERERQR